MEFRRQRVIHAFESGGVIRKTLAWARRRPNLEIFNKPFEKCHEMFGLSNVPRNCFLEKVFGENYITAQLSP